MKKYIITFAAFALTAAAQQAGKVGIVHIQNAIINTKEGKKAAEELQARLKPKGEELEKKKAEIAALRDQLEKTSSVGSDEVKQKLARDIESKTRTFNRAVEDAQAEANQEEQRIVNELGGKLMTVLDKYAKDNGYSLVLDVSNRQSSVLFAANGIDITQEVIDAYDKAHTVAAATPAAPAASVPAKPVK